MPHPNATSKEMSVDKSRPMDLLDPLEAQLRQGTAPPEHAVLPEAEQEQIVMEWNATHRDYPTGKCLHHLFEGQVERTPDAVAVSYEQEQLTYRELNSRANRLAHYLTKLGVGPEKLVGICMERSVGMVVGVLGVLKAGGAYVPLDPAYPQERIAFMLHDSQAQVLITQRSLVGTLPVSESEVQVVCLDGEAEREGVEAEREDNPQSGVVPGNAAYVIYTSGSTGIPKGVLIEHHSAVTFVYWSGEAFSAAELAGVLRLHLPLLRPVDIRAICDLELWWQGNSGEQPPSIARSAHRRFADNPDKHGAFPHVGIDKTVKAQRRENSGSNRRSRNKITILRADGEPGRRTPYTDLVRQVYTLLNGNERRVLNLYGPTEDTTYSTFAMINRGTVETGTAGQAGPAFATKPPIGRPIANTQAYILDERMQPVPPGVVGELYLGGSGLARGYLHRPSFTASRFLPNPFSSTTEGEGERGCTGRCDLVRYVPSVTSINGVNGNISTSSTSGTIEYVGRVGGDGQVKLWGLRIELGEIEAALLMHPAVQECGGLRPPGGGGLSPISIYRRRSQ